MAHCQGYFQIFLYRDRHDWSDGRLLTRLLEHQPAVTRLPLFSPCAADVGEERNVEVLLLLQCIDRSSRAKNTPVFACSDLLY